MSPASMRHLAMAFGDEARTALLDGDNATARLLFALGAAHESAAFAIEEERAKVRENMEAARIRSIGGDYCRAQAND